MKKHFGGDERDRTDDPLLAKQVLSQLSYTPRPVSRPFRYPFETFRTSKIKQRLLNIFPQTYSSADLEVVPENNSP